MDHRMRATTSVRGNQFGSRSGGKTSMAPISILRQVMLRATDGRQTGRLRGPYVQDNLLAVSKKNVAQLKYLGPIGPEQ